MKHIQDRTQRLRVDLAAMFRIAVRNNWNEGIFNHFSLALGDGSNRFLINPKWIHFLNITASRLIVVDADDPSTIERPDAPDPTAWAIHGKLHSTIPGARCALHVHSEAATALACLDDPTLWPLDQNSARFFNRCAIDDGFGGIADSEEEGARLANAIGERKVLVMRNHGVMILGRDVAEAFDTLYYFERSCRTQLLAYASGKPIRLLSDELAESTARQWEDYSAAHQAHFDEMKLLLDRHEPDYAT